MTRSPPRSRVNDRQLPRLELEAHARDFILTAVEHERVRALVDLQHARAAVREIDVEVVAQEDPEGLG